jgi:hypothetical protein
MVTAAAVSRRIDQFLGAVLANVQDFPELAEEWDTLPDGEQASTALHWDHLMLDYLTELDEHYRAGEMSDAQATRYRGLLDQLRHVLPLIRKLRFSPPPITIVAPSSPSERIDAELAAIEKMVADLPGIDRDWDRAPKSFLAAWSLDWEQAMSTFLPRLGEAHGSGGMSAEQAARYCHLLAGLRGAMPILKRRDLRRPRVALDCK